MSAEPVPIVPLDDGNFTTDETTTVVLGECRCPGRPHLEDTADIYLELPWGALLGLEGLEGPRLYQSLMLAAIVSWSLVDLAGEPIPVNAGTIGRLKRDRVEAMAEAINASLTRAMAQLPNASRAPSRLSRPGSASPNPTIRPHAKRTKSR